MAKLSFLDKLRVLFEVSKSSKLFLLVIAFLLFLGIVFYTTNQKNKKTAKTIYLLCMLFVIIFLLISYYSSIGKLIDYMMNNVFISLYFPNLAIYVGAIIVSNVILLISIFNYKISKIIKNINITIYLILNYILALILNIITKYKLDIFSTESIYGNKSAQALIELSSIIFIVWIIFLVVYKLIMIYLKKEYIPPVKKVVVKKRVKVLPENIVEVKYPQVVKAIPKKQEEVYEEPKIVPLTKEEKILKQLDKMLTIDDYKLLLKLLKKQQLKEIKEKENNKIREINDLYKSVK